MIAATITPPANQNMVERLIYSPPIRPSASH
jgi:hypothetical protein